MFKEASVDKLKYAIEPQHECTATFREAMQIHEYFNEKTVWEGIVHVFDVDHPQADTAYAWTETIEDSNERSFIAVLGIPPLDSPVNALRIAIAAQYQDFID